MLTQLFFMLLCGVMPLYGAEHGIADLNGLGAGWEQWGKDQHPWHSEMQKVLQEFEASRQAPAVLPELSQDASCESSEDEACKSLEEAGVVFDATSAFLPAKKLALEIDMAIKATILADKDIRSMQRDLSLRVAHEWDSPKIVRERTELDEKIRSAQKEMLPNDNKIYKKIKKLKKIDVRLALKASKKMNARNAARSEKKHESKAAKKGFNNRRAYLRTRTSSLLAADNVHESMIRQGLVGKRKRK